MQMNICAGKMVFLFYFTLLAVFLPGCATRRYWIATEGEAFVVECARSSVTWYFGNTSIPTDKKERIHSFGRRLWFLPASPKDSGNYTCVHSKDGSSEVKTVTIYPHKEGSCYYENALYSEIVGGPRSGKIYCPSFANYKRASDLKWYKDCKELHGSRYLKTGNMLAIEDTNENDTGKYTCQFTFKKGGRKFNVSATRSFRIKELSVRKPLIILYPQHNEVIEVKIGLSLNLSCKALMGDGGDLLATGHWEYTGEQDPKRFVPFSHTYMESHKNQFTEAILQIKEMREEDLGLNFTCHMTNDKGYKRVSITLRKNPSADLRIPH